MTDETTTIDKNGNVVPDTNTITTKTKTETTEETVDTDNDGKFSNVEILRFSMRPFLIVWFSMTLSVIAFYGIQKNLLDAKETLYVISGIMSTIIGYVCGKSSKVDKE